ncbi:MAG: LemA family protein [Candidatus Omnitrophica bacterium]|nr:LemA family protein [Candidatus Omnitrophota bacterium]
MRGFLIAIAVLVGLVVIAALMLSGTYNSIVSSEEGVKEAWAQVENVYQRRLDLVPNLVETVKGYAAHERQTLEEVVKARASVADMKVTPEMANDPDALAKFENAQKGLSSALSRLLVVVERYPDLKASQNFLALQSQLEGTENRIAVERRRFNEMARQFNTKIRVFPSNLIANFFGFHSKAYFQAEESAKTAPKVAF